MLHHYREPRSMRYWLMGLLWTGLVLSLVYSLSVAFVMLVDPDVLVDEMSPVAGGQIVMLLVVGGVAVLGALVYIPSVVMFCVWIYRASTNARALGARHMTISAGWSVGWFFIPFANWVMPYKAMSEIVRASDPDAMDGRWHLATLPGIVPAWWACWLISGVASQISWRLDGSAELITAGIWLDVFSSVVSAGAAWLAILIIQRIHRDQQEKARRVPEVGQSVCMGCGYDLRGTPGTHCPECGTPIPGRDDFVVYPAEEAPRYDY